MAKNQIDGIIKQQGYINIADFMQIALQNYYNQNQVFGKKGDFVTAPEISQLFGEILSAFIAYNWINSGKKPLTLVELGPGKGTLMHDILRASKNIDGFHQSIKVKLLEQSNKLKSIQKQNLENFDLNVSWVENLEECENEFCFFIANEFFDALPIHQYILKDNYWHEIIIVNDNSKLDFAYSKISEILNKKLDEQFLLAKNGDIVEINPVAEKIFDQISSILKINGGMALICDYGYYYQQNYRQDFSSTLQALKNHQYHPVLEDIGEADITAHVDFYKLAKIASNADLIVSLSNQGDFLRNFGINERAKTLIKNADEKQKFIIKSALNRLTSKNEMGDLFKILVALNL